MKSKDFGYTLIETLAVIFILILLATISFIPLNSAIKKARDTKRKSDIQTIGRFLILNCYLPDAGVGAYDLNILLDELKAKNPDQKIATSGFTDPLFKNRADSGYIYLVNDQKKCALYTNLENSADDITLPDLSAPTAGGGSGVFRGTEDGVNHSKLYFQVSN